MCWTCGENVTVHRKPYHKMRYIKDSIEKVTKADQDYVGKTTRTKT